MLQQSFFALARVLQASLNVFKDTSGASQTDLGTACAADVP
jgi:hypothetical protein